ncbi:MAG: Crp/Fnr family transcriptional regulator [Gammaproteobacteria bacterium]|nr:Crp/Fnr family transcriptional regulator [Gammaproteobacteria bacterium]
MHMSSPSVSNNELHQLSLLSHLNNRQLNDIQGTMKLVHLAEGEHLFEQGQKADRFYMVRSGQIKLYRLSIEGSERVIDVIQPGQVFAECVLFLDNGRYPVGAEALNNTELLSFDFITFKNVLNESKDTCFQLMSDMSMCMNQYLDQVDYLTLQNASFRLVNYLLQQVPDDHKIDESCVIQLNTSKSIIASCLSIQPETFSRILKSLKNRNLIEVNGKAITIHNIADLKAIAA